MLAVKDKALQKYFSHIWDYPKRKIYILPALRQKYLFSMIRNVILSFYSNIYPHFFHRGINFAKYYGWGGGGGSTCTIYTPVTLFGKNQIVFPAFTLHFAEWLNHFCILISITKLESPSIT